VEDNKKVKKDTNNKFLEFIKRKLLIDSSKTIVLVVIILAFFIGITVLMQRLQLAPIDLTEDKLFTLTNESKEQVKNIDKDVNIYFIGYQGEEPILDLAKQYTKVNEKINIETVTATDRPDLVERYEIDEESEGIIVECGKKSKVLASNDLYTYDYTTYETISVAEEKLTASIKSVVAEKIPKVYFLNGYSYFLLNDGMQYLNLYLTNEVTEVESLDILTKGKVPEDCDTLVITSPQKDFDDIATTAIIDYINNGGNILWLNGAIVQDKELNNVNKILAMYGVNPFEVGIIGEKDSSKMVLNEPFLIVPEMQYSDVTSKLKNSEGVILKTATKINVVSDDVLKTLNTTKIDLLKTSENSYFKTNFANDTNEGQTGSFLVGAEFDKTIVEANEETGENGIKSKLIIYGENSFISDKPLAQNYQTPMIVYGKNRDLVLNSIAYLSDREEDITVRKATGNVTYTATEQEHRIILAIIIGVPVMIIIVGVIIWIKRRKM